MSFNKRMLSAGAADLVPSENFGILTWTGNDSNNRAITGLGFQPDLVWIKRRADGSEPHALYDSTRGPNKQLETDDTAAEATNSGDYLGLPSFDSNGFSVGNNGGTNRAPNTYVAWCWKVNGGTTVTNNTGSITSYVQTNDDAGISMVKFTGTGANATVGHGLSAAPELIIFKAYSTIAGWKTYSNQLTSPTTQVVELNDPTSAMTPTNPFNSTAPSSTVISVGSYSDVNNNGNTIMAYCFRSIEGYSKHGKYTGNGSVAGPIVETGFEVGWLMIKRTDSSDNWYIIDNARSTTNPRQAALFANLTDGEYPTYGAKADFLSNGFQIVSTDNSTNANGGTFIYLAFATDPDEEAPVVASSFNIMEYTGDGSSSNYISGLGFKPNFVWGKSLGSDNHRASDSVTNGKFYYPNLSNAADAGPYVGFNDDGFTMLSSNNNTGGTNYVAWCWKGDDNEATIKEVTEDADAIAIYKFEDNANDVTGDHNGTASGVSYVSGKFNKAASFDNNASTKITLGTLSSVIPNNTTGVSFSFWVYLDSVDTGSNYDHWFIGQEDYGGAFGDGEFSVRLYEGKVYTDYAQSSSIYRQRKASTVLSTGQWYHIVATYDTSNANITEVYLNGVLETSSNVTSGGTFTTTALMQNSSNMTIGGGGAGTDGEIDQFRIYDKVLNAESVTNLYNETAAQNNTVNIGTKQSNSIESIVSVNAAAGFSIVKWTGDGNSSTEVPHGLSATPEWFAMKDLSESGGWNCTHVGLASDEGIGLGSNAAAYTSMGNNGGVIKSNLGSTTFGFTAGAQTVNSVNKDGNEYIAFCWHGVTGYSKFGTYTGNGSSTGPSVTTGFKPDFLMVKKTNSSANWRVVDGRRGVSSSSGSALFPNLSNAEFTGSSEAVEFTSTGFQIKNNDSSWNGNSDTFIYWAIAKNVASNTTLADSFNIQTWTGNNTARSISGLGFRPDFIWFKCRSVATGSVIHDAVRGPVSRLFTYQDNAASNSFDGFVSFDSDGFSMDDTGSGGDVNAADRTYVAWCWKAGNTWQSNIDGTIPSVVNVNTGNGFSIVKYRGDGTNGRTIGHGLGATPEVIFVKNLDAAAAFAVYHGYNTANPETERLKLNTNDATLDTDDYFNDTAPTSSVFTIGTEAAVNTDGEEYIAYCWAPKSGFSKFGSYTGNGGTQSITGIGFKPDLILFKKTNATQDWLMVDSKRGGQKELIPNSVAAEYTMSNGVSSFDSDGWTMGANNSLNTSSATYIYMAFKMNLTPVVATGKMAYMVLAGGASGASNGGGGGAGGLRTSFGDTSGGGASAETVLTLSNGTYTITIGGGGAGLDNTNDYQDRGNAGSDSTITGNASVSTNGGGAPGSNNLTALSGGGCGGGQGAHPSSARVAQVGTTGEGYAGGATPTVGHPYRGGGGGGTGQAGFANNESTSSNISRGGDGLVVNITGSSVNYGAGGGGTGGTGSGYTGAGGTGGTGGGGNGGAYNGSGTAGTANTGSGGGATGDAGTLTSGAGGSGLVVLRMRTADYSGTTTGSPTVITVGDETILKYTGSGTYVHS